MHKTASDYMHNGGILSDKGLTRLHEIDKDFIARNISPGGCADLLAVAIMLYFLE